MVQGGGKISSRKISPGKHWTGENFATLEISNPTGKLAATWPSGAAPEAEAAEAKVTEGEARHTTTREKLARGKIGHLFERRKFLAKNFPHPIPPAPPCNMVKLWYFFS